MSTGCGSAGTSSLSSLDLTGLAGWPRGADESGAAFPPGPGTGIGRGSTAGVLGLGLRCMRAVRTAGAGWATRTGLLTSIDAPGDASLIAGKEPTCRGRAVAGRAVAGGDVDRVRNVDTGLDTAIDDTSGAAGAGGTCTEYRHRTGRAARTGTELERRLEADRQATDTDLVLEVSAGVRGDTKRPCATGSFQRRRGGDEDLVLAGGCDVALVTGLGFHSAFPDDTHLPILGAAGAAGAAGAGAGGAAATVPPAE